MSSSSEREEGEIVDEYEYIVSSDEEIVRQRIQELEEKNYELEKIAEISGVYSHDYDNDVRIVSPSYNGVDYLHPPAYRRNAKIPDDVSSISSLEFHSSIQKHKRSRNKEYRKNKARKKYQHSHKNRPIERSKNYQQLKKLRTKIKSQIKTISQDCDEHELNNTNDDDDDDVAVNRNELSFAVARNSNIGNGTNTALKERLRTDKVFKPITGNNSQNKNRTQIGTNAVSQSSNSPVNLEESTSIEENELRLIALKSAVLNKHMARKRRDAEVAYSPTDFDDLLSNGVCSVDEDNMELDIADLTVGMDISPAASPDTNTDIEIVENTVNTRLVDMDIAQSDSEDELLQQRTTADNWKSYEDVEYSAAMHYGIYMPEMQYQMLPIPPPPPPMPPITVETSIVNEVTSTVSQISHQSDIEEEEEEEHALRALLLAKIQSTKAKNNQNSDQSVEAEQVSGSTIEQQEAESTEQYSSPTESILKQAVLRFRNKVNVPSTTIVIEDSALNPLDQQIDQTLTTSADETVVTSSAAVEVVVKPRINVRSVSTINADYDRQQALNAVDTIIILSEDEQETPSNSFNDNALRDISYNVQNQPDNNQQKNSNTLIKKTNIPIADSQIKISETQQKSNQNDSPTADLSSMQNKVISTITKSAVKPNKSNQVNKSLELKRKSATAVKNVSKKPKTINAANISTTSTTITAVTAQTITATKTSKTLTNTLETTKTKTTTSTTTTSSTSIAIAAKTTTTTSSSLIATSSATTTTTSSSLIPSAATTVRSRSRLITVVPDVEVPKLIITINTADSSDEFDDDVINTQSILDNNNLDLLQQDIASPISLRMNSPVSTPPQRCASPANNNNQRSGSKALVNDTFNKRLDEFLKNIRTCIASTNSTSLNTESIKQTSPKISKTNSTESSTTPMALKHLPVTAQEEYQRLMQRMKLLEQQKQKKLAHEQSKAAKKQQLDNPSKTSTITTATAAAVPKATTTTTVNNTTPKIATTFVSANKKTLIKKVLVKNATNTTNNISSISTATSQTTSTNALNDSSKQEAKNKAKANALNTYEKSYEKLGGVIVSKLDKSLQQVEEVRQLKIKKIQSERLVRNLKLQLREAQQQLTVAQSKMTEVFPSVRNTHQLICALKRRRLKIGKAVNILGKSLNGDDYRLKNDTKLEIVKKMEKLAKAILEVNKIKATATTTTTAGTTRDCGTMTDGMMQEVVDISSNAVTTGKEPELIDEIDVMEYAEYFDKQPFIWEDYVSPLSETSAKSAKKLDPNGILCPFSLSGECQDNACIYEHLNK